jgi:hypothetical protein
MKIDQVAEKIFFLETFREYIPSPYWGAVGNLLCTALRRNHNNPSQALAAIREQLLWDIPESRSPSHQILNNLNDQVVLMGLFYFSLYDQLSKEQKKRLKAGAKFPLLPKLLPPKTDEGWREYYQELIRIQKARGYKQGWIYFQLKKVNAPDFLFNLYQEKSYNNISK